MKSETSFYIQNDLNFVFYLLQVLDCIFKMTLRFLINIIISAYGTDSLYPYFKFYFKKDITHGAGITLILYFSLRMTSSRYKQKENPA
jgi:hypothetical protein